MGNIFACCQPQRETTRGHQVDLASLIKQRVQEEIRRSQPPQPSRVQTYDVSKLREENAYLNKEIARLQSQLVRVETNHIANQANGGMSLLTSLSPQQLRQLSMKRIDEFVNEILANPDTNIGWLPDAVESRLYRNFATVGLKAIEAIIENSNIHVMGHKISFVMDPDVDKCTSHGVNNDDAEKQQARPTV